jgi:hypothetical protein
LSRGCRPDYDTPRARQAARRAENPWEAWEPLKNPDNTTTYYLRLDGTAGALTKALLILPADTKLDLGGAPDGASPGDGIWYTPVDKRVSVL